MTGSDIFRRSMRLYLAALAVTALLVAGPLTWLLPDAPSGALPLGAVLAAFSALAAFSLNVMLLRRGTRGGVIPYFVAHSVRFVVLLGVLGGICFRDRHFFISFAASTLTGTVVFLIAEVVALAYSVAGALSTSGAGDQEGGQRGS